MRKELGSLGAIVGMVLIGCLFVGLALAIYPSWPAIGQWMSSTDAPAWVQAVGSIAAIFASGGIASWQIGATRRAALEDRKARGIAMVEVIRTLARAFSNELRATGAWLNSEENAMRARDRVGASLQFGEVERSVQAIPLHEISDAATVLLVVELLRQISLARESLARIFNSLETELGAFLIAVPTKFQSELDAVLLLEARCDEAIQKMEGLT